MIEYSSNIINVRFPNVLEVWESSFITRLQTMQLDFRNIIVVYYHARDKYCLIYELTTEIAEYKKQSSVLSFLVFLHIFEAATFFISIWGQASRATSNMRVYRINSASERDRATTN